MLASDQQTLFWYDYETSGADPKRDRPLQFAGVRTDLELNPIEEPVMFYARPAEDFLPHPMACLITGLTPQKCLEEGLVEAEFIARVEAELARPGTCSVGYNTLRFDDEVTRFTLYRNFYDPYAREWQQGCSRWDIIDMVRLTRSLRPEGIVWPSYADGRPSLRLEDLAQANGLDHGQAHDALSDVYATLDLARLIRRLQPKLYDYVFQHRSKQAVTQLLDFTRHKPLLHISSRYGQEYGHAALIAPLARHPQNPNAVIVWDLRQSPQRLLDEPVSALRQALYSSRESLPEGYQRPALKLLHLNRCPILAPAGMLNTQEAQRLQISGEVSRQHLNWIRQHPEVLHRVAEIYAEETFPSVSDPDQMLYSGGFFSDLDKRLMEQIRQAAPADLADLHLPFQDPRLEEMFLRYKARNYPEALNEQELMHWEEYRARKLLGQDAQGCLTFDAFYAEMNRIATEQQPLSARDQQILEALADYAESIYPMEF